MTNVATYQNISNNVSEDQRWLAYIVLPTGDFWHVRFNGATEEIARSKAIALWTKENAKWDRLGLNKAEEEESKTDPWLHFSGGKPANEETSIAIQTVSGRGAHFAGKVWMRNADGLKRVALTEIALYEKNGFHRSSPRGK